MEVEPRTPEAGRKRPLTPDDLLRLEELGEAALSPDGLWLAYVVKRARATAGFHKYDFLDGSDRGDVWLVDTPGGVPQNLTRRLIRIWIWLLVGEMEASSSGKSDPVLAG